ncbi:hypothetical protein C8F01DRAFT_1111420 [Mycena amicta]|nr:hypothetical protein C8F01DRAFT_1111420 [Mycena amicta]
MSKSKAHPDLHLSKLELLPLRARITARAVCEPDCPRDVIESFKRLLKATADAKHEAPLFLPAVFTLLHPSKIPASQQLDDLSPALEALIGDLAAYVHFILAMVDPTTNLAYIHVWLRLFPWVDFFSTYSTYLPLQCTRPLGRSFLRTFMLMGIRAVETDDDRIHIMSVGHEPRFWLVLARAWCEVLDAETGRAQDEYLDAIHLFLQSPSTLDLGALQEGSGGTPSTMGYLIARDLKAVVTQDAGPHNAGCLPFFTFEGLHVSIHLVHVLLEAAATTPASFLAFLDALLVAGFVPSLIRAAYLLTVPFKEDHINTLPRRQAAQQSLLTALRIMLIQKEIFLEALSQGLLTSLVATARCETSPTDLLSEIFSEVLIPALTDPVVLLPLSQALQGFSETEVFQTRITTRTSFRDFVDLANRRLEILSLWNTAQSSGRLCDGFEGMIFTLSAIPCTIVGNKHTRPLRRCAGCTLRCYCSTACQRGDWVEGGHRKTCVGYSGVATELATWSTPRTRSFLRFLMQADYTAHRTPNPTTPHPHIVLFDYRINVRQDTSACAPVEIRHFDNLLEEELLAVLKPLVPPLIWDDLLSRWQRDLVAGIRWNVWLLTRRESTEWFIHRVVA